MCSQKYGLRLFLLFSPHNNEKWTSNIGTFLMIETVKHFFCFSIQVAYGRLLLLVRWTDLHVYLNIYAIQIEVRKFKKEMNRTSNTNMRFNRFRIFLDTLTFLSLPREPTKTPSFSLKSLKPFLINKIQNSRMVLFIHLYCNYVLTILLRYCCCLLPVGQGFS